MLLKEQFSYNKRIRLKVSRRIWGFTKNKLCHRYFDNNLQIFSKQIYLRIAPDRYFW